MNQLFNVVNFVAVPAGGTVSLPHGLNEGGVGVIPDEIKRRSSGNFTLTADATNVTATNNGGAPADCQVLCERWHSIERELGVAYTPSDLSPQPWETDGDAEIAAAPVGTYVFRPGAVGADAPGGNVYTVWSELWAAITSSYYNGRRILELDSRFSPYINPVTGDPACLVPAGTWDMSDVEVTIHKPGIDSSLPRRHDYTFLEFSDDAVWENLQHINAQGLYVIGNNKNGASIPLETGRLLQVDGWRVHFINTDALAKPLFEVVEDGGTGYISFLSGNGQALGGFTHGPSAAPTAKVVSGRTLVMVNSNGYINDDCFAGDGAPGTGGVVVAVIENPGAQNEPTFTCQFPTFDADGGTFVFVSDQATRCQIYNGVFTDDGDALYSDLTRVDTTNRIADLTITLPPAGPRQGEFVAVKDVGGDANLVNQAIVVAAAPGDTIDGGASLTINTSYGSLELRNDGGTNWWSI